MPFRSKDTLERWLAEFLAGGRSFPGTVEVLPQDGTDGGDTGLVVVGLKYAPTQVYMEPAAPGDPHWTVTFLAREVDTALDVTRLQLLAGELSLVSELCAHLQARSTAHVLEHGIAAA
ncbi:hypothetical protein [Herbiconiux liangxiaofengii]|uniref:hypothetical protein n=1 Tax=Herbiconiux liangxiaofengii TaxID=3342795 RepID=UPI0035BACC84